MTDAAGNPVTVDKGDQTLTGFAYSTNTVTGRHGDAERGADPPGVRHALDGLRRPGTGALTPTWWTRATRP